MIAALRCWFSHPCPGDDLSKFQASQHLTWREHPETGSRDLSIPAAPENYRLYRQLLANLTGADAASDEASVSEYLSV